MKIFANYGAMSATAQLNISKLSDGIATTTDGQTIKVSDIRSERPASGSPIGLYWNEQDAY
jgi:hypothetical protein